MKKNLSILIYSLASGGAERVVSILLNELKERYNITLILMNHTIFYDLSSDIKIIFIENSNPNESGIKKLLKLPLLAWKYKRINNSDISLSFMNRPNYINILAKLMGMRGKIIINERAMPSLQHKNGLQGDINRFLIKSLYNRSDLVIANAKGNSLDLKNNFNIQEVLTINNPFDIEKIEELSNKKVDFKDNSFSFITVGRLDSGKNHRLIIEAMQDIDAKLYIIGDGELKDNLELIIKNLKLEDKVFLLGRQKNPYKYIAKADCFVFSSNYEGFPNVLLEALACRLPIISTDCQSGPREILAPDSNMSVQLKNDIEFCKYGVLTPINDKNNLVKAMDIMIKDDRLRDEYRQKAKKRANDFNKNKIINKWIEVLCAQ